MAIFVSISFQKFQWLHELYSMNIFTTVVCLYCNMYKKYSDQNPLRYFVFNIYCSVCFYAWILKEKESLSSV
jgi:hypothetical protein